MGCRNGPHLWYIVYNLKVSDSPRIIVIIINQWGGRNIIIVLEMQFRMKEMKSAPCFYAAEVERALISRNMIEKFGKSLPEVKCKTQN